MIKSPLHRSIHIKNLVSEQDFTKFMGFKVPDKAIGFFSEGYSGDKESFLDQVENDWRSSEGVAVLVDKATGLAAFNSIIEKMNEQAEDIEEVELEFAMGMWELGDKVILLTAEFGGSYMLGYDLEEILKGKAQVAHFESFSFEDIFVAGQIFIPKEEYLKEKDIVLSPELEAALQEIFL